MEIVSQYPSHLFLIGNTPDEFFGGTLAGRQSICWAWMLGRNGLLGKYDKLPKEEKMWFFNAPFVIGGYQSNNPEYFHIHNRTVGRAIWEYYDSFFGIVYDALDLRHTFVEIEGLEYPVFLFSPKHSDFRITYPERWMWDKLNIPKDCTYEQFKHIAAYHISKRSRGWDNHIPFSSARWIPKDLDSKPEFLDWAYTPEMAQLFITGYRKADERDTGSHGGYQRAIEEIKNTMEPRNMNNSSLPTINFSQLYGWK